MTHFDAGQSAVETLNAWSTFGAAVATSVSAAFIAWQIVLTRKSVQATQATLQVAAAELDHSRRLRVEAQRAAIDAEMPKLFVTVSSAASRVGATDDREKDLFMPGGSRAKTVAPGTQFVLPRDSGVRLEVMVSVNIANDGPRRAKVAVGTRFAMGGAVTRKLIINVGEDATMAFTRIATVAEWVQIAEDYARGVSNDVVIGEVTYQFPGDTGATELHEVAQGGTVVEPVPGQVGAWKVRDLAVWQLGSVGTTVYPFTREYWSSRLAGEQLW